MHCRLAGRSKTIRVHNVFCLKNGGIQVTLGRQAGRTLHHGLDCPQTVSIPQLAQELDAVQHIKRVLKESFITEGLPCHSLNQIGGIAIVLELGLDALAQELEEIRRQRFRIHLEIREAFLPLMGGLLEQRDQIKSPATIPEDLQHTVAGSTQRVGIG